MKLQGGTALLLLLSVLLTGCQASGIQKEEPVSTGLDQRQLSGNDLGDQLLLVDQKVVQEKEEQLEAYQKIIEAQLPHVEFSPMEKEEVNLHTGLFQGSYACKGWQDNKGSSYILGISLKDENPLEEFVCGQVWTNPQYSTSQFMEGRLIVLEGVSQPFTLLPMYEYLDLGDPGLELLDQIGQEGGSVFPVLQGPFVRIPFWQSGRDLVKYFPVSEETYRELAFGTPIDDEPYLYGELAVFLNLEEMAQGVLSQSPVVTVELLSWLEQNHLYVIQKPQENGEG